MIQRVQSIYLLLVTILMSLFLFSSYAFVTMADTRQVLLYTYAIKMIETGSQEIISKTLPLLLFRLSLSS